MHIGLYFGSFNPIHNGHTAIALYMLEHYDFEQIWIIVTPNSPFKSKEELIDENIRLQMVKLATEEYPDIIASDFEFDLPRPSYTYMTLHKLRMLYYEDKFSIIMGSDNVNDLEHWKKSTEIIRNHKIYIYPRKENISKLPTDNFIYTDAPIYDISSTEIRNKVKKRKDVSSLVHKKVLEIIIENELYQEYF